MRRPRWLAVPLRTPRRRAFSRARPRPPRPQPRPAQPPPRGRPRRVGTSRRWPRAKRSSRWAHRYETRGAFSKTHAALSTGFAQIAPPVVPPEVLNGPYSIVGQKVPRVHGLGVVTGLGQYTEHMTMPGTLYTRTLRSPHPHARVKSVDVSKAEKF